MGAQRQGSVADTALQCLPSPRINIPDREAALGRSGLANGFGDGAFLDAATIEDAGLVEMDMRLDQARDHQASAGLQLRALGRKIRSDGSDGLALDGDVGVDKLAVSQNAGITNDLIHHFTALGHVSIRSNRNMAS